MGPTQIAEAYERYGPLLWRRARERFGEPAAALASVDETLARMNVHARAFAASESKVVYLYRILDAVGDADTSATAAAASSERDETHPPLVDLDSFSAEDLAADSARGVALHVSSCETCGAYVRELVSGREWFLAAHPPAAAPERIALRAATLGHVPAPERASVPWSVRLRRAALALALTIALGTAFMLMWRTPRATNEVPLKGPQLAMTRTRGADAVVLAERDRIRRDDVLRIVIGLDAPTRVAGWYVDARGHVTDAFVGGAITMPVGHSRAPGTFSVPAPCVDLTLVVVALDEETSVGDVDRRIRESQAATGDAGTVPWAPAGALVRRLRCE